MQEYKPFKSGKVREMYDVGDSIIMVATDRISAFDHILKNMIVKKGTVLVGTVDKNGWLKTTHGGKAGYVRQKGQKVYMTKL